jgi:hypothetical protein
MGAKTAGNSVFVHEENRFGFSLVFGAAKCAGIHKNTSEILLLHYTFSFFVCQQRTGEILPDALQIGGKYATIGGERKKGDRHAAHHRGKAQPWAQYRRRHRAHAKERRVS